MNRDRSFHYENTSPGKGSPNTSYPRKLDTLDTSKQTRTKGSLLNNSKENISPTLAGGMRDVLLMKCKQAIEELHIELESEKKIRQEAEDSLAEVENELHEKDSKLREIRYSQEKLQDEIRTIKSQNESLKQQLEHAEEQIQSLNNTDMANSELQSQLQTVRKTNNEMKVKIKELETELEDRDLAIKHWNDTLSSVQQKLMELESENQDLKREYKEELDKNNKLNLFVEDSENASNLLKHKQRDLERVIDELREENSAMASLREQNGKLINELQEYQKELKIQEEESHIEHLKLEEHLLKEKEELEDNLRDKHRRAMNDIQEKLNNEISRLRQSNEEVTTELHRVKSERDSLKQDVSRLENKIQVIDDENKKMIDNIMKNYESLGNSKDEEAERLKRVIEDQEQLVDSYKTMLEKEREESATEIAEQNNRAREEINELKVNNEYMTTKLRACQEELTYLRKEVHNGFSVEEQRQEQLARKLRDLESEVIERNTKINLLNEQLDSLRTIERRQGDEIEAITKTKRKLEEDLLGAREQIMRLERENNELRDNNKDFHRNVQGKMSSIAEELEHEQERRIQAESKAKIREERILELEAKMLSYRKQMDSSEPSGTRTQIEVSELPSRTSKKLYDTNDFAKPPSTYNSSYRQESSKIYQSGRMSRPEEESHHHYPLQIENQDIRKRIQSKERSFNVPHRIEGGTPQRLNVTSDSFKKKAPESPEYVHHRFMNKFKNVIEKLENKLESITADIGSPNK